MDFSGKRVFVTGGTGFIGSHLVSRLVSLGANVKLLIHESRHPDPSMTLVHGRLSEDHNLIRWYVQDFAPEFVFHLAAQPIVGRAASNSVESLETNARGSYLLLDSLRDVKTLKSVVYISTDKVYGDIEVIGDDSELLGSGHPYNASKLMGDISAQLYEKFFGLPISIIRHGNIYGKGDLHWDRIIPRTLLKIFHNESPVVRGKNYQSTRDYIYVDDIVDAYLCSALLEKPSVINLGAKNSYSAYYVVSKLLEICDRQDLPIKRESLWPGELVHQHFEETESSKLIGWNPKVGMDEGLMIVAKWYMEYFKNGK